MRSCHQRPSGQFRENGKEDEVVEQIGDRTRSEVPNEHKPGTDQEKKHGSPSENGKTLPTQSSKPNINVNIDVDSTMDPDKLERQLELLKRFGAL
jgi:hypothetical protein